jgi:DNA-binding IclR family transcriptional regulator
MDSKAEGSQAVVRAARILRCLSSFGVAGASLAQLGELTGIPKATAHRILSAMHKERLVERPPGGRLYRLGPDMFSFGLAVQPSFDLQPLARPSLERLSEETRATVYLGIRSGYDTLCLDRADPGKARGPLAMDVADRWPLGVGSISLAMLAFMPENEIMDVIRFNQRRVDREDAQIFAHIRTSIERTRRSGFAMRISQGEANLVGIAVPIFDRRRYPVASFCAVSTCGASERQKMARRMADALQREAGCVGALMLSHRPSCRSHDTWRQAMKPALRA